MHPSGRCARSRPSTPPPDPHPGSCPFTGTLPRRPDLQLTDSGSASSSRQHHPSPCGQSPPRRNWPQSGSPLWRYTRVASAAVARTWRLVRRSSRRLAWPSQPRAGDIGPMNGADPGREHNLRLPIFIHLLVLAHLHRCRRRTPLPSKPRRDFQRPIVQRTFASPRTNERSGHRATRH
jgi:hypothetical protein